MTCTDISASLVLSRQGPLCCWLKVSVRMVHHLTSSHIVLWNNSTGPKSLALSVQVLTGQSTRLCSPIPYHQLDIGGAFPKSSRPGHCSHSEVQEIGAHRHCCNSRVAHMGIRERTSYPKTRYENQLTMKLSGDTTSEGRDKNE